MIFFFASSLIGDQCFWGLQIGKLGLGPRKPLRAKAMCASSLVEQLREVLDSPRVIEAAKIFGGILDFFFFFFSVSLKSTSSRRGASEGRKRSCENCCNP